MKANEKQQETTSLFYHLTPIKINKENWFVTEEVTTVLELSNPEVVLSTLDNDEQLVTQIFRFGKMQSTHIISESGLYTLIFASTHPIAKKFRKWVTSTMLPMIRSKGSFNKKQYEIPNFVLQFNRNWNRIRAGYFSVLSELFIRLYAKFEHEGYTLPNKTLKGTEMRPDISVSKYFHQYLRKFYPHYNNEYNVYRHKLPEGKEISVRQYRNHLLPIFIKFLEEHWIPNYAYDYFKTRDKKALKYLPKFITY